MPRLPQIPSSLLRLPRMALSAGRGALGGTRRIVGRTLTGGFEAYEKARPGPERGDGAATDETATGTSAGAAEATSPVEAPTTSPTEPDASVARARPAPAPHVDPELAKDLDGEWERPGDGTDPEDADDAGDPVGAVGDERAGETGSDDEPLLDPGTARSVRTEAERGRRASDPESG